MIFERLEDKARIDSGLLPKHSSKTYLAEAELHGRHVYWHGALNAGKSDVPPAIDTAKAQDYGNFPCFFFTTHFGYALSYVYPDKADSDMNDSKKRAVVYKPFSKFAEKIPMKESLIAGTEYSGWVWPVVLPANVNIFLAGSMTDKRKLQELVFGSEYKSFYNNESRFLDLFGRLSREDWFFLDKEKEKYGFGRNELLGLIEKGNGGNGYTGFFGFHNFETENKLSSIGLFKSRMSILQAGKPFKVEYKDGCILISET